MLTVALIDKLWVDSFLKWVAVGVSVCKWSNDCSARSQTLQMSARVLWWMQRDGRENRRQRERTPLNLTSLGVPTGPADGIVLPTATTLTSYRHRENDHFLQLSKWPGGEREAPVLQIQQTSADSMFVRIWAGGKCVLDNWNSFWAGRILTVLHQWVTDDVHVCTRGLRRLEVHLNLYLGPYGLTTFWIVSNYRAQFQTSSGQGLFFENLSIHVCFGLVFPMVCWDPRRPLARTKIHFKSLTQD